MQGILTNAYLQRQAAIGRAIMPPPENLDFAYDLIKSASEPQKRKVKKVMDKWKSGSLKSGSGGKVTNYKQAVAIALSEAGLHKAVKMCKHGEELSKCTKCNPDLLKKDMEMGSGEADGGGVVASVEKGHGEGSRGGKV